MIKLPRVGPRPIRRSIRRTMFASVLILAMLLFVGLEAWTFFRLSNELSALESRGESVSLETFLVPEQEGQANASDALDAACALIRLSPDGAAGLPRPEDLRLDDVPAQLGPALHGVLAVPEYRLALDSWDMAGGLQFARYLQTPADRPGLSALQQRHVRDRLTAIRLARLLQLRAYSRVVEGLPEQAYEDILGLLRLSLWIHQEMPVLFSWLLSVHVADIALTAWEQLATRAPPPPDLRQALDNSLARLQQRAATGGLPGERAFMFQLVRRSREVIAMPDNYPGAFPGLLELFGRWALRAQAAESLRGYGALINWSQNPPYRRPEWSTVFQPSSVFGIPADIMLPNLRESVAKSDRLRARIDLARLAVARRAFEETTGESPRPEQSLAPNYLPELPLDPWSGEPFALLEDEAGCRLTSTDPGEGLEPLTWRVPCTAEASSSPATSASQSSGAGG